MPIAMLHVCSLSRLAETVERTKASRVVSLINADTHVPTPAGIDAGGHLFLGFNDIVASTPGLTEPGADHVAKLLDFVGDWDRRSAMVIHCWAGISRSTAGAFITVCALRPDRSEHDIALQLRTRAPSATPNARLVALADDLLARNGRMIDAIRGIGRGADAFEGTPFSLEFDRPA